MTETTYTAPRLERSRHSSLGGVCPALARATGTDVVLWRVLFLVLLFFNGIGFVLYVVAWVTIPLAGERQSIAERVVFGPDRRVGTRNLLLLAVVVISLVAAIRHGAELVALAVVVALAVLWSRRHHGGTPEAAPLSTAATAPATAVEPVVEPIAVAPVVERERPCGPSITGLTLSIAALVVGVLLTFSAAGTTGISADIVIASALGAVGIGLAVSSVWGRSRGLVPVALVLALGLAVSEGARPALDHGVGNRNWNVVGTADASYRLGIGNANLYLASTYPGSATPEHIKARVDLGQLQVHVPFGVRALVITHVHLGAVKSDGVENDGRNLDQRFVFGPAGPPQVIVNANVGTGQVEVWND